MPGSRRTSFVALTQSPGGDEPVEVDRVEIPIFQRDYAQGRLDDRVQRIRSDFLDVLQGALAADSPAVGLDFVYGGVQDGTLRPLDGQQRLTTLFLVHWYVSSRADTLDPAAGWTQFSYATRQSARMFCESLIEHPLPPGEAPREWIIDQPWYLYLWRHDPTIQAMLVMLGAIHDRFGDIDPTAAWGRLIDDEDPAIWFLLLPLSDLDADGILQAEDLYIKMNSRGKPLTEFENFKAHFEKTIQWSERLGEFATKVDTEWSDLLWDLRGDDDLVDDEFLRYIEFITEICEWLDGAGRLDQPLAQRSRAVFGEENPRRGEHLDLLFKAFDVWADRPIGETFSSLFASGDAVADAGGQVRLFFRGDSNAPAATDLFEACCRSYGESRGRTRSFSLGQTVLLYAVLLHLIEGTPEETFRRRLRVLRNLIEASTDELRPQRMPQVLNDVHVLVRDGAIDQVAALNQAQAADEIFKASVLDAHPGLTDTLFRLEDHEMLRGSLGAFELEPETLPSRAATFEALMARPDTWDELLAALLACGEYQRQRTNSRPFLFGTNSKKHDAAWRELLTGPPRDALAGTRQVLCGLLDRVNGTSPESLREALVSVAEGYVAECESKSRFDWRYYMVKYPAMREHGSSTYFAERAGDEAPLEMGYSLCKLRAGGSALNGYYHDPFLLAMVRELEDPAVVEDKWFMGYEWSPRRLPLTRSGVTIRCVPSGFELTRPPLDADVLAYEAMLIEVGAQTDASGEIAHVGVPQVDEGGASVDTADRVVIGADLIRRLVTAGL